MTSKSGSLDDVTGRWLPWAC